MAGPDVDHLLSYVDGLGGAGTDTVYQDKIVFVLTYRINGVISTFIRVFFTKTFQLYVNLCLILPIIESFVITIPLPGDPWTTSGKNIPQPT